jgi:hypothetical protein
MYWLFNTFSVSYSKLTGVLDNHNQNRNRLSFVIGKVEINEMLIINFLYLILLSILLSGD